MRLIYLLAQLTLLGLGCLAAAAAEDDDDKNSGKEPKTAKNGPEDEVQVSGWLRINERWPKGDRKKSFFYTMDKGHHQIDLMDVNGDDDDRVEIRLEYYFNYSIVRPAISLVPCDGSSMNLVAESSPLQLGWLNHSWTVVGRRCNQRNTTYNIILHDQGDVFAWSSLWTRRIAPAPTTRAPEPSTIAPATITETPAFTSRPEATMAPKTTRAPTTAVMKGRSLDSPETLDKEDGDVDLHTADLETFEQREESSGRKKRQIPDDDDEWNLICDPGACNSSMVQFSANFSTVFEEMYVGSPPDPRHRLFVNTKNDPLSLVVEAADRDLAQLDVCLEFVLFMDANTTVTLNLNDSNLLDGHKQLERITRTAEHWAAGGWETIKRCISDYMPKLAPIRDTSSIHRLELSLIPYSEQVRRGKILVQFVDGRTRSLRELRKLVKFLPNAANLNQIEDVDRYWIIDRTLVRTPQFRLSTVNERESEATQRVLIVEEIEPTLDYFDLTSRWIQIDELDKLDSDSTVFKYKLANKPDWIEKIEFAFQKDKPAPGDVWHIQQVYPRANETSSAQKPQQTDATITLKKVTSNKGFRLRLRHYIDKSLPRHVNSHNLTIRTLSMGDACVLSQSYCLNKGQCQPTDISRAKCLCLRGYSGKYCENSRPCDAIYSSANLTGSELCQSVGAKCAENIPVFRCIWPDDKYLQCSAFAGESTTGAASTTSSLDETQGSDAAAAKLKQLDGRTRRQSRLIFILSALLATAVFVAIISVVNLGAKLRKSRSRLETAQVGVHELTRQFRPNSSGSANLMSYEEDNDTRGGASKRRIFSTSNSFKVYNNRGFDNTD